MMEKILLLETHRRIRAGLPLLRPGSTLARRPPTGRLELRWQLDAATGRPRATWCLSAAATPAAMAA
jgi:hypothetical protein